MTSRDDELAFQREVATVLLENLSQHGFVLTGSGALREHGIINRPTEDVDLFTNPQQSTSFQDATSRAVQALKETGYDVEVGRDLEMFKNITITRDAQSVQVDFGVDYRGHAPAYMDVGAVLDIDDAVGSKVSALYGRHYPRDFLDVDSIRQSGRYSDEELLNAVEAQDPGFDREYFSHILAGAEYLTVEEVGVYGVDADQLQQIQHRLQEWVSELAGPEREELDEIRSLHRADFPRQQQLGTSNQAEPGHNAGSGPVQARSQAPGTERGG
ncbi:nucleotidyl transferase AbiEii/AbiGii toxin family protein [Kocuria massiliensis]|uniref:nucleotidyl transferase AbiEii/AbiGii toxin family protein n=1 Tax=Kocuria massiliensis TaxID=1926282 RepID=UPI000A1CC2F7|nr:nucleotidyl transferase AbiEii/AbiGii toxin family protein [Kocuria massiliensis]